MNRTIDTATIARTLEISFLTAVTYRVYLEKLYEFETNNKTRARFIQESENLIRYADFFVVNEQCSDAILHAAKTLPVGNLTVDMLPSETGYVFFDKDIPIGNVQDRGERFRSFSWRIVRLLVESKELQKEPEIRSGITWEAHYLEPELNHMVPGGMYFWEFGDSRSLTRSMDIHEQRQLESIISSFFLFVQQKIVISAQDHASRHVQRQLKRIAPERQFPVSVVQLRTYDRISKQSENQKDVDWAHWWIVRGHWRMQPYKSTNEKRRIWITPYPKGDRTKPFLASSGRKIFSVER